MTVKKPAIGADYDQRKEDQYADDYQAHSSHFDLVLVRAAKQTKEPRQTWSLTRPAARRDSEQLAIEHRRCALVS